MEEEPITSEKSFADGFGNEVYMILAVLGVGFLAIKGVWFVVFATVIALFFLWRLSLVFPPVRAWYLTSLDAWRKSISYLTRFIHLSMKKKTVEVNSEMGQLQGVMAARPTTLFAPSTFLTPVWLTLAGLAIFAAVLAWALWMRIITIPSLERALELARANSAVAVNANRGWEEAERGLRSALAQANETITRQQKAAIASEAETFKRGRAEGLRIRSGREKQKELEANANRGGALIVDPDRFLRDIGIEPEGSGDAPGADRDASGGAGDQAPPR